MALWHQIRRFGIQRVALYSQDPNFLYASVRSFAVPAHVKAKQNEETSGPRINGAITSAYVRLVTDQGHDVVSRREALDRAKQLSLDLVEVQRTANPPVCKLMDFYKEKFKQELKEKERAKSKSISALRNGENKEVRFTAKTELKDLKMKAETVTRLMERGYRVKCTVLPSGKEEEDLGGLLPRLLALIEDVAVVESGPHVVETRQAYIIVRHVKFSTKKSGKKAIKAMDAVSRVQSAVLNKSGADNTQEGIALQAEEWEPTHSETESEVLSDQVDHNIQQSGFRTDDREEVFGFDSERSLTEDMNSCIPLPQKPSSSKLVLDTTRPKLELNKEETNLKSLSAPQPEPSVVEVNRYAKQSEPTRFHQNRERTSPRATRNENDNRGQFDLKQSHLNNSSNPSSPSSGYGRLSSTKPAASVDQNKVGLPTVGKLYDPKTAAASDQKPGGPNISKPGTLSSGTPRFGNFISSKTVSSSDRRNSGEATVDQTRNPSSPSRSCGIFSSTKTVASGDQSSKDGSLDKPGNTRNPSSPSRSYGIFSKSKTGSAGEGAWKK